MKNVITNTINTLPVVAAEDGIPRVQDTDLGAWLGYKNPKSGFRQLIRRHLDTLEEFGLVASQVVIQQRGNRGGTQEDTEFHLSRDQAVYITSQAGTPKARALTVVVVKVFGAWLDGTVEERDCSTCGTITIRLLKIILACVLREDQQFVLASLHQSTTIKEKHYEAVMVF